MDTDPLTPPPGNGAAADAAADAVARLDAVRRRLADHNTRGAHAGLTGADPRSGERWDAGQVWAHLAEFPAYWLGQLRHLAAARAAGAAEPVPFGRTAADGDRTASIERDRLASPAALHARVDAGITAAAAFLGGLPGDAWSTVGRHPTLGEMALPAVVERFLVSHLEEHADQLDELKAQA